MTTHTELWEIISNGENSGVEFKRDVLQNYDLAKELVAFSNLRGGIVLLGVEDGGSIFGITRADIEEWVMTTCRDKIRPAIIPFFEIVGRLSPEKCCDCPGHHGFDVHSLWHNNSNKYYIRVGTQSREATPEELARLFHREARSGLNYGQFQGRRSGILIAVDSGIISDASGNSQSSR